MKGRILGFFIGLVSVIFVTLISLYLLAAYRYRDGFSYNTQINGIFCTGKDVETVNNELSAKYEYSELTVISDYGNPERIKLKDIDFSIDFTDSLNRIIENQNYLLWFLNVFENTNEKYLEPVIEYDKDKLRESLLQLEIVKNYCADRSQTVEIRFSPTEGYYLFEDVTPLIDFEAVYSLIEEAIENGNTEVTILDDAFSERPLEADMVNSYSEWNEINPFFEEKIVYDMGAEKIPINVSILSRFVTFDDTKGKFLRNEDGSVYVDKALVEYYIDSLCDMYDTYKKKREYTTAKGDKKEIDKVYYGTLINRNVEKEYLYDAVINGKCETHVPTYIREGYVRGLNDIGPNFVEIDLTNQVLYIYLDNKLDFTTDIVTGRPSAGDATPAMVCNIIKKRTNVVLRGEGYRSPVKYWMPIHGGIGIHDASWQKAFGSDRYLRYGSHGCINVSLEDAATIYEKVSEGMPVIVYK